MPYSHAIFRTYSIVQLETLLGYNGQYMTAYCEGRKTIDALERNWLHWRLNQQKIYRLIGKKNARTGPAWSPKR